MFLLWFFLVFALPYIFPYYRLLRYGLLALSDALFSLVLILRVLAYITVFLSIKTFCVVRFFYAVLLLRVSLHSTLLPLPLLWSSHSLWSFLAHSLIMHCCFQWLFDSLISLLLRFSRTLKLCALHFFIDVILDLTPLPEFC